MSHRRRGSHEVYRPADIRSRETLRQGRDLQVSGLRDRAMWVYVISRLNQVLPQHEEAPLAAAA